MSKNLSSTSLRALLVLTEKREKLTEELAAVERQIATDMSVFPQKATPSKGRKGGKVGNGKFKKAPVKTRKRGAVKDRFLAALKEAGDAGIAVKDLCLKLGVKPQNLHVWFNSTGNRSGLVKSLGKGIYRLA